MPDGFDILLLGETSRQVLAFVIVFLAVSWGAGRSLRLAGVAACTFGYLILCGASALALFVFRQWSWSLGGYGAVVLAFGGMIVGALRVLLPPPPPPTETGNRWLLLALLAGLLSALWVIRAVQVDPSANMSSHHGWYPLYIESAFAIGWFAKAEEMNFGIGYLTSISYSVDLMGLAAFGRWLGIGGAWAAYSAGSILAAGLSIVLLASGLRRNALALLVFAVLVVALSADDFFYRTSMLRNWGDSLLLAGGAAIIYFMSRENDVRASGLWAAAASIFLVFSRHYGAFYSGMILIVGYAWCVFVLRDRRIMPWFGLGVLLVLFSLREIACILYPPSPFYPGQKLVEFAVAAPGLMMTGMLNDLGVLADNKFAPLLLSPRNIYLVALLALGAFAVRRRSELPKGVLFAWFAPLLLLALPQALQLGLGYRSSYTYSKTTLVGLHLMTWYPAFVLCRLAGPMAWNRRWNYVAAAGVSGAVLVGAAVTAWRPSYLYKIDNYTLPKIVDMYRNSNPDYQIAKQVKQNADFMKLTSNRPIIYFHYEPGLGIRNFIGGKFFCDYDFWQISIQDKLKDFSDFDSLMRYLGWPNVYLSFEDSIAYGRYSSGDWQRMQGDLKNLENAPWVEKVIRYKKSALFITRPLDPSIGPQAPACLGRAR
ncbi:MAG: hypothetical protein HYU59_05185 [Magnetospirillum gryphiswaldense]|nr:hypothetical protein [Magnetospirillum gryphiswaldense]